MSAGMCLLVLLGIGAAGSRIMVTGARSDGSVESLDGLVTRLGGGVPTVELTDQDGRRVSLAAVTGPILLTFAYGHCTTVCPTVVRQLQASRVRARRSEIPIFVVTLDPWRDPPERLASMAAAWGFDQPGGDDRLLSGAVSQVEQVLDRLGIGRRRDPATGELVHSSTIMLLHAGRIVWRLDGGWQSLESLLTRVEQRQAAALR